MIIDSHLHFGILDKFNMPINVLMESLDKYKIDFGIVSNIEANEFGCDLRPIAPELALSQVEANMKTLELVKKYPGKLTGLFWIKPNTEQLDSESEKLILNNRQYFAGLKLHPYHSDIAITDKRCERYLKFADKYKLPFVIHTAADEKSDPYHVYRAAQQYPDINFIMVHMGLGTDNSKAIEYISKLDNLYGDTTWVSLENTLKAVEICGSRKILFGTDSPIDGVDTYEKYLELLNGLKNTLCKQDYDNITCLNAQRIFNLASK